MTRVLSVEDDKDLQRLIELALVAEGFEMHKAFSGPEGLDKALSLAPDALLCDIMLPGFAGTELIKRLRAEPKTRALPIVVMSAFYDTATLVESEIRRLGVVEYLRKPVRMKELVGILRRLEPTRRA